MPFANSTRLLLQVMCLSWLVFSAATAGASDLSSPFTSAVDGFNLPGGLISDRAHNLYGTTAGGGEFGWGTVFQLTPEPRGSWTEIILYSFAGAPDGESPVSGLIMDRSGNLYGITGTGGKYGWGTVFELMPAGSGLWAEKTLHDFQNNGVDGIDGLSSLTLDASGNLYGTSTAGGPSNAGIVFELQPAADGSWTEIILHSFNTSDGNSPFGPLMLDQAGNLYGTTYLGGAYSKGTVFELQLAENGPTRFFTVLQERATAASRRPE